MIESEFWDKILSANGFTIKHLFFQYEVLVPNKNEQIEYDHHESEKNTTTLSIQHTCNLMLDDYSVAIEFKRSDFTHGRK